MAGKNHLATGEPLATGRRHGWKRRFEAVLALAALAACGGESARQEVRVSAAASLTDAFARIEDAFEARNPGLDVVLNLAGSAALREQILAGAPADVFAAADPSHLDAVARAAGVEGEPRIFARNRLQVAVPSDATARVRGLADLAREPLLVGLCAEGVPCGDLARRALDAAGIEAAADTLEPNVRALLTKIEAGELDAGIVYATDVASSDAVRGIDLPEARDFLAAYPIARLAGAPHPEGGDAFVAFVLSADGLAILARHGFAAP